MLGSAILRPSARTTHSVVKQRTRRYRYLPTPASFSSSSSTATVEGRRWRSLDKKIERPNIVAENKCAVVTSWDLLRGPTEALALVRAVEHEYGPVESYIFQKDFDHPYLYQTVVKINFRDKESLLRVPERPKSAVTIHLRAPKVQVRRPGGIGLDEILPLLSEEPEVLSADQVSEMLPEDRSIDFRINRSANASFVFPPYRTGYPPKQSQTGFEMLKWGGFYDLKPIDSTHPITNEDLTKETLEHIHMRMSLRDWAKILNQRNPYELYPDEQTKDEGLKLESESSLDEKEETLDDLFVFEDSSTSTVSNPNPVRDPFEEILDMEDIDLTGTKKEVVGVAKDATEVFQSAPTPLTATDSTSQSNELQHQEASSLTSPSVTQSTSQSSTPSPTPEVEVQEQGRKQPNREVDKSIKAQLSEAKKLRELASSTGKPKEKQNAKTKSKNKGKKQKATPKSNTNRAADKQEPEPQSRFGGLFGKIQSLFGRS